MSKMTIILAAAGIFLLVLVALIAAMFVSLARQGDERRRLIIEKASTGTFAVTVLYLLFCVAERVYQAVSRPDVPLEGLNPFVTLAVIAMIYAAELFYFKRKYGD